VPLKIHRKRRVARTGPDSAMARSRRRPSRRALPAAVVVTSTALVLAACGGTSAPSSASTGGVQDITWQTMWSGNTLTLLNQMVSEFNSTHPDIHVTESNIPSSTGDAKLLSEIAAGDPAPSSR
jgi:ABC-type glycerol-3-phosphate transport system substrate-binding protein